MGLITHIPPFCIGIGSNQYSDPLGMAQQRRRSIMRRIFLVVALAALMAIVEAAKVVAWVGKSVLAALKISPS